MTRTLVIALIAALFTLACTSQPETVAEPEPVVEATPAPEPVAVVTVADPTPPPAAMAALPKTASALPWLAFAGVSAFGLAGFVRVLRRGLLQRD